MGVGAGLYMYDVVVKTHVRYLISWWVLVYLSINTNLPPIKGYILEAVQDRRLILITNR